MLYYEGTANAVSFKFYLRKEKIFMKKKSNILPIATICMGLIGIGMSIGIMMAKKAQGGHR